MFVNKPQFDLTKIQEGDALQIYTNDYNIGNLCRDKYTNVLVSDVNPLQLTCVDKYNNRIKICITQAVDNVIKITHLIPKEKENKDDETFSDYWYRKACYKTKLQCTSR